MCLFRISARNVPTNLINCLSESTIKELKQYKDIIIVNGIPDDKYLFFHWHAFPIFKFWRQKYFLALIFYFLASILLSCTNFTFLHQFLMGNLKLSKINPKISMKKHAVWKKISSFKNKSNILHAFSWASLMKTTTFLHSCYALMQNRWQFSLWRPNKN